MNSESIKKTVLAAAQEVFSTMLGMDAEISDRLAIEEPGLGQERVAALIGLAGHYIGTGMIGCSANFACKVASAMMMTDCLSVDGEVLDAIGEIANMIFGNVKTDLESEVGALGLSIPTVVFGRNFRTRSLGSQSLGTQSWVDVPIQVEDEAIEIRFCLAPNSALLRQNRQGSRRGPVTAIGDFLCSDSSGT